MEFIMFKKQFLYSLISLLLMSGFHSLNGALNPLRLAHTTQANASAANYSAREKAFADTSNPRDLQAVNLLMSITLLEKVKAKNAATQLQKTEQAALAANPDNLESDESDSDTEPALKKAKTEKLQGDQPKAKLAADIPPKRQVAKPTQLSHQKSTNKKVLAAAAAASIERPKRRPTSKNNPLLPKKSHAAQVSSKEDTENQSPNESDPDYEESNDSTGDDATDCDDDKPSKTKKKPSKGKSHANHQPRPCTWPQCRKILSSKIALEGHLRTHSGETPFKCALCDKKWALRGNTVRHYIRDHVVRKGSNPGKATVCGTCIKLKNKSAELQKHLRDAGSNHIIDSRND